MFIGRKCLSLSCCTCFISKGIRVWSGIELDPLDNVEFCVVRFSFGRCGEVRWYKECPVRYTVRKQDSCTFHPSNPISDHLSNSLIFFVRLQRHILGWASCTSIFSYVIEGFILTFIHYRRCAMPIKKYNTIWWT